MQSFGRIKDLGIQNIQKVIRLKYFTVLDEVASLRRKNEVNFEYWFTAIRIILLPFLVRGLVLPKINTLI